MAEVNIIVNGISYHVTCDDGQEARLVELAMIVDRKIDRLAASLGQIGDQRLLLLAALTLADEAREFPHANDLAAALDAATRRIEALAARV